MNTSRIGQNLVNTTQSNNSSNPITSFLHNITSSITNEINQDLNNAAASIAKDLGLKDFYSVHILDYCEGAYTPAASPNATVKASDIHKNISDCSNRTALFHFNATDALQQSLTKANASITLSQLKWPSELEDALNTLRVAAEATFVLYCIGIGLMFIALLFSLAGIFSTGRLVAFLNVIVAFLAFLSIGIASAIVTAIIVKGSNAINKYGKQIGVEADRGRKFEAITWASTGLMLVVSLAWILETCIGHRRRSYPNNNKIG